MQSYALGEVQQELQMSDVKEWENPCSKDCLKKRSTAVVFLLNCSLIIVGRKNKTVKGSGKCNKLYSKGSFSFKEFFLFGEQCPPPSGKVPLASARVESCLKKLQYKTELLQQKLRWAEKTAQQMLGGFLLFVTHLFTLVNCQTLYQLITHAFNHATQFLHVCYFMHCRHCTVLLPQGITWLTLIQLH